MRALCFLSLALLVGAVLPAHGPFKQRSADLDWHVLKSANFDVYYYPEEEGLARRASAIAEKALAHVSRVLDYYPKARQPLFIFQNHLEFQQTNISREAIGPGTGGFTEAFKNRMVLPTTQSDKWLDIVITHELAHAIQFNLLYGEGARSFQVFKNYVIPLWVMEGSAEYAAQNWDSYADMVMRDAVLNERLPDLDLLDGFNHLDEVYVAYKGGQTAIQYLADTYGADAVPRLLKKYKAQISTGQIIRDLTGRSFQRFNHEWKASLRQKYWLQAKDKQPVSSLGTALTWDDHQHLTSNNGAVFSPDGRRIAFMSTRRQKDEVWVMGADGKDPRPLFSGPFEELGRSGGYGVSGSRLSWSPDGKRLAFIRARDGRKRLVLGDVAGGRLRELETGFREIAAPAWSPDGSQIAFSGAADGRSQVYRLPVSGGVAVTVTAEGGAVSLVTDPAWSPDGRWLAYSAEVGGRNQVFVIGADGSGRRRVSPEGFDCLMPAFSADGSKVFFSTDDGGGYNLAWAAPDGTGYERLSNVVTGVFHPRPSADGRWLAFVAYEDGCQNIYRMTAPGYKQAPPSLALQALINPYRFAARREGGPQPLSAPARNEPLGPSSIEPTPPSLSAHDLPPPEAGAEGAPAGELVGEPYRTRITPDLFFLLAGYDSYNGLVGGGYVTASDMVGDHNLAFYANFVPGYQSVVQGDYLFLRGRSNVGLSLFYRNTSFFLANLNPQTVRSTFLDQDVGGQLFVQRPLSKFTRVDFSLGARRLLRELNGDAPLDPAVRSTLGDNIINSVGLSVHRDTHTYKNFDTYSGYRLSLSSSYADKVLGGTRNFTFHQAEARGSLPLGFISRDAVLSARVVGLEQTGLDRQVFYFGGAQVRGLSYNEEIGQRYAFGSVQFRHPYLKNLNGSLWPLESLLIKHVHMVGYYDLGLVTDRWEGVTQEQLRAGYGGGLRLQSFLFEKAFLLFAFDIAQRTDRYGETYYYFTLGQIF
jgi:WD40 repeat protein